MPMATVRHSAWPGRTLRAWHPPHLRRQGSRVRALPRAWAGAPRRSAGGAVRRQMGAIRRRV